MNVLLQLLSTIQNVLGSFTMKWTIVMGLGTGPRILTELDSVSEYYNKIITIKDIVSIKGVGKWIKRVVNMK